ncbi:hypothetical protein M427DRAFT_32861 [Gonapodya prolifera JEL478]|uniref:P-loop containing nucleoside triphosphate hydrolase protein n=1 Tax=Gonapodya prolifera (strain JEL478) TaxID=1344416 RepID=A0A139AE02_GONPJ|nr:hypothetical protein M427DRAFT_32861 [Gonapodya prolifera JEL478]|eukprot:KXS14643.1 hypothetical protein M427DRAFT_32861 [Gonapodya prolifera JEL478]
MKRSADDLDDDTFVDGDAEAADAKPKKAVKKSKKKPQDGKTENEVQIPSELTVPKSYDGPRDSSDVIHFLGQCVPDLNLKSKRKGTDPIWIVAVMSAERLTKKIVSSDIGCAAKLFGRHMKMPEQVEFLAGRKVSVAVGTPNRLVKLMEISTLRKAQVLVLDGTYHDKKQRTISTLNETKDDIRSLTSLAVSLGMKIAIY